MLDREASNRDNDGALDLADREAEERAWAESLEEDDLAGIVLGDELAETADGCQVEPDGRCPHGYRSPLLTLGLI